MSKRFVVYVLCLAVLNLGSPLAAQAGMVSTLQAVEASTRVQDLATVMPRWRVKRSARSSQRSASSRRRSSRAWRR